MWRKLWSHVEGVLYKHPCELELSETLSKASEQDALKQAVRRILSLPEGSYELAHSISDLWRFYVNLNKEGRKNFFVVLSIHFSFKHVHIESLFQISAEAQTVEKRLSVYKDLFYSLHTPFYHFLKKMMNVKYASIFFLRLRIELLELQGKNLLFSALLHDTYQWGKIYFSSAFMEVRLITLEDKASIFSQISQLESVCGKMEDIQNRLLQGDIQLYGVFHRCSADILLCVLEIKLSSIAAIDLKMVMEEKDYNPKNVRNIYVFAPCFLHKGLLDFNIREFLFSQVVSFTTLSYPKIEYLVGVGEIKGLKQWLIQRDETKFFLRKSDKEEMNWNFKKIDQSKKKFYGLFQSYLTDNFLEEAEAGFYFSQGAYNQEVDYLKIDQNKYILYKLEGIIAYYIYDFSKYHKYYKQYKNIAQAFF